MSKGRVIVAMSGGVDSSVSAALLREQGYDVVGLFMRTGAIADEEPAECAAGLPVAGPARHHGCCSALDARDARRVADRLDIPFYALNFAEEFDRIKDYYVAEYLNARTPNPCVMCNTWLKFGKLWEYAAATGADRIATGHYARIVAGAGESQLHRAVDPTKDQSYFLFGLRRELLERVLFPVGEMTKDRVRALAEKLGLEVHNKPDSQEVCFVPDGDHRRFIARHRGRAREEEGEIVDETGRKVGVHTGVGNFTIGQRRGLRVAVGEPRYVVQLDAAANRVVIGPREMLLQDQLEAERVNWLSDAPTGPVRCSVKIRYLHPAAAASVEPIDQQRVRVRFDVPQSAVTPGQAAVFYHGNRVLGGGWIR